MSVHRLWVPNTPYFRGSLLDCLRRANKWHSQDRWIIEELTPIGWKIVRRFDDTATA